MFLKSPGLKTYIWNNNIKSLALLLSFPFLIFILLWLFFFSVNYFSVPDPNASIYVANQSLLQYWPLVLGGVGIWFFIAYFFHASMINAATGAVPAQRSEYPELYNLLENLCISRGMVMPKLYIIDTDAMNAFATGINKASYSVTVTRGLLNNLDKDELEAVLAHELTHIINRDVRLLIVCVIFVGIFSFLAQIAFNNITYGRWSFGRRNNKNIIAVLIAAALLFIGYMLALVIRFNISRKREYMADAGSLELTKNPLAMIHALKKISGHSEMANIPAEVSQMFIDVPPQGVMGLFATHPPIEARIKVLEELGNVREEEIKNEKGPWQGLENSGKPHSKGPWEN